MPNQSLVDLTERTATADSDLIHVNSGGTDYKQTKLNFLRGDFFVVLSNSASITSSAESLEALGTYFGSISSYGHQSETGVPENTNFYFKIQRMGNANYISIELWNVNNVEGGHYIKSKVNGTWGDWVKVPSRSEITALNNSLATKQDNLEWKLVYNGSIAKSSSYTHASNNSHTYLVVFGTWNFKGVYFVNPQNGGTPQVASVISTQACSFSASGTWGFTVNNVNTTFPMPVYIFQL